MKKRIAKQLVSAAIILAGFVSSVYGQASESGDAKVDSSFSVHEWGVFTVPRGADWLKQDMLREWQGFPAFFHGTLPDRGLVYRGPVTKPVVYFHGEEKTRIELLIRFSTGQPLIWWPPVEHPANPSFGFDLPKDWKDTDLTSVLRYSLTLNETGRVETVPDDHWVNHLRKVDAARVAVYDSNSNLRAPDDNRISESFIYYDGLMEPPKPPIVERTSTGIAIITDSDHDLIDVWIIERNVDSKDVALAQVERIKQGQRRTQVELVRASDEDQKTLVVEFRQSLVATGLLLDEAQSLIDVWSTGLFEQQGLTIFYRVPQETYDRWIPLHFNPKPEALVRVGLVVHQHLEPELEQTVTRLIEELRSDQYNVRDSAERQLHSIGGAALDSIRTVANSNDLETATRARQLIKNLDTDKLLEQVMSRYHTQDNK